MINSKYKIKSNIIAICLFISLFFILKVVEAQIILTCSKDSGSNGVYMSWNGDTLPYEVARSTSPNPFANGFSTIADNVNGYSYTDAGALAAADNYYYQVGGATQPLCSSISPVIDIYGRVNDTITITGSSLSSSDTKIYLNKIEITPTSQSNSQITFTLPAGSLSGSLIVSTTKGATNPKKLKVESAWGFNQITHINYANNYQWVDDNLGPTGNTIFIVDNNGAKTRIGTLNRPNGLPVSQVGGIFYTWYGNSLENPFNRGTINRTNANGQEITWGSIRPTGQTAYCAALAFDNVDTSFVYAADSYNGEIRKVQYNQFGGTLFASPLTMNNPAGMAVDNINPSPHLHSLWVSLSDRIRQYSYGGVVLKQYTDLDKISSYPAGMNFDDEGKLWLAKRAANKIERIDTVNDKFRELNISINDPIGVATARDADNNLIGFAAEGSRIITFPHNKLVRLHIKIVNNAFSAYYNELIQRANDALSQCGIEVQVSGLEFINMTSDYDEVEYYPCDNPPNCFPVGEEWDVLHQNRSSSPTDINIYFVKERTDKSIVGQSITSDYYLINNQTDAGIIMAQKAIDKSSILITASSLAHEIVHFLLNKSTWPAPSEHYDPATGQEWNVLNLMHGSVECPMFRLTKAPTASSQCDNINDPSNPFNSYIDQL